MKKCRGGCGQSRHIHQYRTNRHGNLNGTCNFCLSLRAKKRYMMVVKPREIEARRIEEAKIEREKSAMKSPSSVFVGYLFAGDV